MFKIIIILIGLATTAVSCTQSSADSVLERTRGMVKIGEHEFKVEISDDFSERALGLSGHEVLRDDEGMIFVFPITMKQQFWMKDMLYPLDFVWIHDEKVVSINENIPHPSANNGEIARVSSGVRVNKVLEINAGVIDQLGIQVGDTVEFTEDQPSS